MALTRHLPVYEAPSSKSLDAKTLTELSANSDRRAAREEPGAALARIERVLSEHPKTRGLVQAAMVAFYLVLIVVPPWLPAQNRFVGASRFLIWCVWWPLVTLSTLGFGRLWCGVLCPEGALSAFASRFGGQRPIPAWMRWGGIPLLAFVGITVLGQLFEVDEEPLSQLAILGGSTVLAVLVGLLYTRRVWAWCRFLCPVSLLFGVFSRLGALHFRVDTERLKVLNRLNVADSKQPCPVAIHLPAMTTNRYCLMCFRCAGWRDSIHLAARMPGEELLRINLAEPLLWEVLFLFGGAIGLPLGVFHVEINAIEGAAMVGVLLLSTATSVGVLSLLTWSAARVLGANSSKTSVRERFTCVGYAFTPLALFSLFLGLSKPTFSSLESIGAPTFGTDAIRILLLSVGTCWSLYLAFRILKLHGGNSWRTKLSLTPLTLGVLLVIVAWVPVFRAGG